MHRTCIGGGWTLSERSLINSHLSRVLPIIEDIYGQAFMTDKWWRRGNPFVKIIKEDFPGDRVGLTCAPWYAAVCFAITGEFPCTLWPWDDNGYIVINPDTFSSEADEALLTHELFHAFRLNWILTYPQFEEGHAEMGSIEVSKRLCQIYGDMCSYVDAYIHNANFVFHQYYNLPFMGTNLPWLLFYSFAYEPLIGARYLTWAYLWMKVLIKNDAFFRNFNDNLCSYSAAAARDLTYDQLKTDIAQPSFGSGMIENKSFINWFDNQPAFINDYPVSSYSYLNYNIAVVPTYFLGGYYDLEIYYYRRDGYFPFEEPLSYRRIRFLAWDADGNIIKDTIVITDGVGVARLRLSPPNPQYYGRIKVEVCDLDKCSGNENDPPIYSEIMLGFLYVGSYDIAGAVGAEKGIDVQIGSSFVRDTNGVFRSPLGFRVGDLTIRYVSSYLIFGYYGELSGKGFLTPVDIPGSVSHRTYK